MDYLVNKAEYLHLKKSGEKILKSKRLYLVLNQIDMTSKINPEHSDSDFYSKSEVDEMLQQLGKFRTNATVITNEKDFVSLVDNNVINKEQSIVWNMTRQGSLGNKKSLVTSMCDLYGICYIGSSVETMNLCRNKIMFENILKSYNLSYLPTYSKNNLVDTNLPQRKYIIKSNSGAASINLTNESIKYFHSNELNTYLKSNTDLFFAQPFISGYEVEVPIIKTQQGMKALAPIGIRMNNKYFLDDEFLSETVSSDYNYNFYDFQSYLNDRTTLFSTLISSKLIHQAVTIANILNIESYGRVDFRVDMDGNCYCFDIATTPYIIKHSSFFLFFSKCWI